MLTFSQIRRAVSGLVLAAGAFGGVAQAQDASGAALRGGQRDALEVSCCPRAENGTGAVDIGTGFASWLVSSVLAPANVPTNSSPLMVPGYIGVDPLPGTMTSSLAPSGWLQPGPLSGAGIFGFTNFPNGHVTYVLNIRVPKCAIRQKVTLAGQLATDDKGVMFVDGPASTGTAPVGFSPPVPTPYASFATADVKSFNYLLGPDSSGFTTTGLYRVRVEVDNLGGGPFALVLNGAATSMCEAGVEMGRGNRAN